MCRVMAPRGYKRKSFLDLWERYFQVGTSAQPSETATFPDFQTGTRENDVPTWNRPKPKETAACADVPDENRPPDEESPELTLDDLDRMASDDDGWAEFDQWIRP